MNSQKLLQKKIIEDTIKEEFSQTLSLRVQRYCMVKPHGIIPYTPFAAASTECHFLFRDGHFYGCISLAQAVAEAIARFLCEKNSWKPTSNFECNIDKLFKRQFISGETKNKFLNIWGKRDDYHHLNSRVETEREKLEKIAEEKILLLKEVEKEIFKFSTSTDGRLVPENPKYWKLEKDGTTQVFLRLES